MCMLLTCCDSCSCSCDSCSCSCSSCCCWRALALLLCSACRKALCAGVTSSPSSCSKESAVARMMQSLYLLALLQLLVQGFLRCGKHATWLYALVPNTLASTHKLGLAHGYALVRNRTCTQSKKGTQRQQATQSGQPHTPSNEQLPFTPSTQLHHVAQLQQCQQQQLTHANPDLAAAASLPAQAAGLTDWQCCCLTSPAPAAASTQLRALDL